MSHEKDVMATRPLVWGTAVSLLILVLAWAVPTAMEGWLEANVASLREEPIEMPAGRSLPAGPRLQVNPDRDIERLRAAEKTHLASYAWVDPAAGVVRIPIDRAMQLVAAGQVPAADDGPAAGQEPGTGKDSQKGDTP
jgi:hypothetical protein